MAKFHVLLKKWSFAEIRQFFGATDTKRWSFAGPKAANLLPYDAGEDHLDLYSFGTCKCPFFGSVAAGRSPNFLHHQTTIFLRKELYFSPSRKRRLPVSKDTKDIVGIELREVVGGSLTSGRPGFSKDTKRW